MKLFEDYKNLEAREEIKQKESDIEYLLDLEEMILQKYTVLENRHGSHISVREKIVEKIEGELQKRDVPEDLLKTYLQMRENNETNSSAIVRGIFSGILLDYICKHTSYTGIEFDGKGRNFNYLFYMAKNIHDITLKSFRGYKIFGSAAMFEGTAKNIYGVDIEGDELFSFFATRGGIAKNIILTKSKGEDIFFCAGSSSGSLQNVIITETTGSGIMCDTAGRNGSAEKIIIADCMGDQTLHTAGNFGSVKDLLAININGNKTITGVVTKKGSIKNITCVDLIGEENFSGSKITNKKDKIPKEKRKILDEILGRVKNIDALTVEERKEEHEKIALLQMYLFQDISRGKK